MDNGTYTKAGLVATAGAARPRVGTSGLGTNACAWIGTNGMSQASPLFADTTNHLTRRLQESSQ